MYQIAICLVASVLLALAAVAAPPKPLQTFTVKDYLGHPWTDEIVHFPIAYHGQAPRSYALLDADGAVVPCQVSGLSRRKNNVTGTLWTVVSLPPNGEATFALVPGREAPSLLTLTTHGDEYRLGNEHLTLYLPRFTTPLQQPVALTALPAPLLAMAAAGSETRLGQGSWVGEGLQVKSATTAVLEKGPVRVTVRYRLDFTDGRFYQADISLGVRQEVAFFTDDSNIEAPQTAFRFSFTPGLGADRTFWENTYWIERDKELKPTPISFDKEQVLFHLRPWGFWWFKDKAISAGFFKEGAEPFVGVSALRPSRWSPYGWDGFDRTELPITARPGGQVDLSLALLAWPRKPAVIPEAEPEKIAYALSQEALAGPSKAPAGTAEIFPLHRELAFTVGTVNEYVCKFGKNAKQRLQLVKYSQFPLDEVKNYGFDYKSAQPDRKHPFLMFTQADVERLRRQVKTIPAVKAEVDAALVPVNGQTTAAALKKIQQPEGWKIYYQEHYLAGGLYYGPGALAYMGSDDQKYGQMLAAGARGMAWKNLTAVLDEPWRPDLGTFAHVYPGDWTRLMLAYDLLADTDYLSADDKKAIKAALVFGAHVLAHPDYWTPERGLCSANPNMTALVRLPRGLMALYLDGHPEADKWLKVAEDELQREIKEWIRPEGAWVECPGYQGASLDPMLPLMQALKNVKGKNYFSDPLFKATAEYYGFLLTPPDRRFSVNKPDNQPAPMILPSMGDMWTGTTSPYAGWVAQAVADVDPEYSARMEFAWLAGLCGYSAMYTTGFTPILTNPELPTKPPTELSRAFPGFGSIMRTSWTDPRASYLAHRTGPFMHHYHDDFNSFVYYAKGAPLCLDWGNLYQPFARNESWWHNRVSFNNAELNDGYNFYHCTGELVDMRTLPMTIDYSYGKTVGNEKQQDHRQMLLVKSPDPLGANYVVVRDATVEAQPNQPFFWNLFCLAKASEITGNVVHFPGQMGVDLDVHVLSPAAPKIETDHWDWKQYIGRWGNFSEEQYGIRIRKQGSPEDFFTVLYPRAAGQGPAQVTPLANGQAAAITHMEGKDVVLLASGKPTTVTVDDVQLTGEVAFARRNTNGTQRLAVVKGEGASAAIGVWKVQSNGPVALTINGKTVSGESSGDAHEVLIRLPDTSIIIAVRLDGDLPAKWLQLNNTLTIKLPAGLHTFTFATM